jgi:phosphatidylserine decarboxylase
MQKKSAPIYFFNSSTGQLEKEKVYGENYLRWAYENPLGWVATNSFLKRAWFSQFYGWRMNQPSSVKLIRPFIEKYQIDTTEFSESIDSFTNFNDFFYRRLKPEARPIDPDPSSFVFPADGRHLAIPNLNNATNFYVKGQEFNLRNFIADPILAERFKGGSLLISRLCPVDYHRFHFPLSGNVGISQKIGGSLQSVNPIAMRRNLSILWHNRRNRTLLTLSGGTTVLIIEIGATCVGRIHQTFTPNSQVSKGAEKGFFAFGGSCLVTISEPGVIEFNPDLIEHSSSAIETYAKIGQIAGKLK